MYHVFLFVPSLFLVGFFFSETATAIEPKISYGAFIDTQYVYDSNAPAAGDRAFTTQAVRHNEFSINLAYAEFTYDTEKIRSRFALQAGTSVQANYSTEPTNGSVSGGDLSRHMQEARIGYKLGDKTWIDAGVFFAHVGGEGWIPNDNLTLTRSLVADFSPYYLSGIKITHAPSERLQLLFMVTNGWQNISENNQEKNIGTGIEYSFDSFSVAYNTLIGNEQSPPLNTVARSNQFRHFHDLLFKTRGLDNWEWILQYDFGFQEQQNSSTPSQWQGALVTARYKLNDKQKVSARIEHFKDRDQIVITTNTLSSFSGWGASLGFDQNLEDNVLWRLEARYLATDDPVFPKDASELTDSNFALTSSLSLMF